MDKPRGFSERGIEMAIAAVAGSVAMAGTLGQLPRQGAATLRVSSHKAFVPAKLGAQRFRGATKVGFFLTFLRLRLRVFCVLFKILY